MVSGSTGLTIKSIVSSLQAPDTSTGAYLSFKPSSPGPVSLIRNRLDHLYYPFLMKLMFPKDNDAGFTWCHPLRTDITG